MYRLCYSAALFLASIALSHARHTVSISHNGLHSYSTDTSESDVCLRPKCVIAASEILTSLDETVDPCDDFQRFACGGWLKRQEVSEDKPEINIIVETQNSLNRKLRELLESDYDSSDPPFVKMLKDFYNTCTDVDRIEEAGSEPLKKLLSRLGGWPVVEGDAWDESGFDWVDTLISLRNLGFDHRTVIRVNVYPKSHNETVHIIYIGSPYDVVPDDSNVTLGLNDDKIAAQFKVMVKAAKLLGADETIAEKELLKVVDFMIALESSSIVPVEESETEEKPIIYYTVKQLQEEIPLIPWMKFFNGMFNVPIYENETVYVSNIHFFTKLADLLISADKRVIANYVVMRAVLQSSSHLSEEWRTLHEDMKKLESGRGKEEAMPLWKKCLTYEVDGLEIALSSYYVRRYFSDESKDEAMVLMRYIHKEFLKILEDNDWMDEKTRVKAEEKANALKSYIGYPRELLNDTFVMKMYENITITTDSHLENVMILKKRYVDELLSKLGSPEDYKADSKFAYIVRVNAFYNPYDNSIGVPAGILHDVFYEKDRPNYMNFGAIGYVIGHEITHGFDNRGRYFDKDGNNVNWWDKNSDEHFVKKVQCIIDQYDNYTTDIGLKVNGENTQNENIADNGGLKEAYRAYQSWIKDNGIEPTLPGLKFTQNQLFWLSAAHVWCSKAEPERMKFKLLADPHSPGRFRIIGPMSNLEEFSKDFNCSADSPMNRKYKCNVW